jgi:hypothetical protein
MKSTIGIQSKTELPANTPIKNRLYPTETPHTTPIEQPGKPIVVPKRSIDKNADQPQSVNNQTRNRFQTEVARGDAEKSLPGRDNRTSRGPVTTENSSSAGKANEDTSLGKEEAKNPFTRQPAKGRTSLTFTQKDDSLPTQDNTAQPFVSQVAYGNKIKQATSPQNTKPVQQEHSKTSLVNGSRKIEEKSNN